MNYISEQPSPQEVDPSIPNIIVVGDLAVPDGKISDDQEDEEITAYQHFLRECFENPEIVEM